MHIHPNNNLLLATLGAGREETHAIQAKRAAEVRKKLSAASRMIEGGEDNFSTSTVRVEAHPHPGEPSAGDEQDFGRRFSAKA